MSDKCKHSTRGEVDEFGPWPRPAAPPPQSAEQPQGEALTPEQFDLASHGNCPPSMCYGPKLCAELTRVRQQLADKWGEGYISKSAARLIAERTQQLAEAQREMLTVRQHQIQIDSQTIAALESRLQAAQGLVEKLSRIADATESLGSDDTRSRVNNIPLAALQFHNGLGKAQSPPHEVLRWVRDELAAALKKG